MEFLGGEHHNEQSWFLHTSEFLAKSIKFYTPAAAILFIKSHRKALREKEELEELNREKVEAELKYLKSQLNPHFLFNTLNNLYSFVITGSPKAPDIILRLSEILDYALYKSQKTLVALGDEVKTIENYLELEKVRHGDQLNVDFNKNIEDSSVKIAPLIILSLVENAFKHGTTENIDEALIEVNLKQYSNTVNLDIRNTAAHASSLPDEKSSESGGIGLVNIKKQLKLTYSDRHEITVNEENGFFVTSLQISV
ncbi:sensor histidine kinase [Reichenbachiella versicolor]|uniref:sensor histidine kinase n=1 Tax=Reichenbachiella versicolor TaxID=1821036 RepID=UPI0013A5B03F|nr:histidine kinase [Reichenbachiella versicolor]